MQYFDKMGVYTFHVESLKCLMDVCAEEPATASDSKGGKRKRGEREEGGGRQLLAAAVCPAVAW